MKWERWIQRLAACSVCWLLVSNTCEVTSQNNILNKTRIMNLWQIYQNCFSVYSTKYSRNNNIWVKAQTRRLAKLGKYFKADATTHDFLLPRTFQDSHIIRKQGQLLQTEMLKKNAVQQVALPWHDGMGSLSESSTSWANVCYIDRKSWGRN